MKKNSKILKPKLALASLLLGAISTLGFCAFNMTLDNDFTIKVSYKDWTLSGTYVVLPGEQLCVMKGLQPKEDAHYYIYTTVDYGDWIKEYSKELDEKTDVLLFFRGADEDWSLVTQSAN